MTIDLQCKSKLHSSALTDFIDRMKYFVAAHDFHAEEDVELSVDKGEVLCATEGVSQDGWMKVEVIADARRRGFVPMSYLSELTAAEAMAMLEATDGAEAGGNHYHNEIAASSSSPAQTPSRHEQRAAAESDVAPYVAATSTPRVAESRSVAAHQRQSPSPRATSRSPDSGAPAAAMRGNTSSLSHAAAARPALRTPSQGSRHLLENPSAAVDAFMKNEVYFKQLMQRRASALARMQTGIEEAMTEVAACKDRNTVLTRKLRDLDDVVERERERWMQRVDEEKAHVSRTAPYSAAMAVPVSSGTTPVRSPIGGRLGGPGRSIMEENTPRQLRA